MTEHNGQHRIVVGVDGSESSKQALRWAIEQARLTGATLDVVGAWDYPVGYGLGPVNIDIEDLVKGYDQMLAETVAEVAGRTSAVSLRTQLLEGHAAVVLPRAAEGADLLVVGSRGHGGFVGATLGSVSRHCAQHAPCPVVIIRDARHT